MKLITKQEKELLIKEFEKELSSPNQKSRKYGIQYKSGIGYLTRSFDKIFTVASINKKSNGKSHYCIDYFADEVKKITKEDEQ